jgi:hypothetical protein
LIIAIVLFSSVSKANAGWFGHRSKKTISANNVTEEKVEAEAKESTSVIPSNTTTLTVPPQNEISSDVTDTESTSDVAEKKTKTRVKGPKFSEISRWEQARIVAVLGSFAMFVTMRFVDVFAWAPREVHEFAERLLGMNKPPKGALVRRTGEGKFKRKTVRKRRRGRRSILISDDEEGNRLGDPRPPSIGLDDFFGTKLLDPCSNVREYVRHSSLLMIPSNPLFLDHLQIPSARLTLHSKKLCTKLKIFRKNIVFWY